MNHEIHNPHDLFFRETWTNVSLVRSFLKEYLPPEMTRLIALDSLTICKDSFIEPDMKQYYSDVLYQVTFGKHSGFVYFLFEHKSHPDKRIFLQLLRYMLAIWDLYVKQSTASDKTTNLPIVIPLVIYHGKQAWNMPQHFSNCFQGLTKELTACIPDFSYQLHDLSRYTDSEIKGEVMTQITLRILKYAYDDDLAEMKAVLSDSLSKEQGELVMTIAEQLRQEGELIGMQKGQLAGIEIGRQEGRQEGEIIGMKKGMHQTAVNLKALGLSSDLIQQATGLSAEEIDLLDISKRSENIPC